MLWGVFPMIKVPTVPINSGVGSSLFMLTVVALLLITVPKSFVQLLL